MKLEAGFCLILFAVSLGGGCGGGKVNSAGADGGAGGGTVGGSCQSCATDQDCQTHCGAPSQPGYTWCCSSPNCYSWSSATCPVTNSTGGSSGAVSGSGSGGGTSGVGSVACGTAGTCTAPNVCCSGLNGPDECLGETACAGMGGDVYACKGSANCGNGQVCCLRLGAAPGGGDLAQCRSSCSSGTRTSTYQVCQTNADCAMGRMCTMFSAANVTVCR